MMMKRKLAVSENFIISVNMCHCQSIIVVTCITTRNICNIRNSSFQGNIEELAMIKVFLVLSLVAIATLLNISFTDNQERISKEWALFGQCHYKSFIAT
jgi:hypothetical protein